MPRLARGSVRKLPDNGNLTAEDLVREGVAISGPPTLLAFIDPFRKHSRRLEIWADGDVALPVRYDEDGIVAWRCDNPPVRTPEWFIFANCPDRWVRV